MANQNDENMTVEKFLEIQFQVILDVSSCLQLVCFFSLLQSIYSKLGIQTAFD